MKNPKKRRAAGAGRPPSGPIRGKSKHINIRCQPGTRARLEAERGLSGQSISQIAEQALIEGLDMRADRNRDDPLKELFFLISELAWDVSGAWEPSGDGKYVPLHDWRTDPTYFEAFRYAVNFLLAALRPEGEGKPLKRYSGEPGGQIEEVTPETHGRETFGSVWRRFLQPPPPELSMLNPRRGRLNWSDGQAARSEHRMYHARRILHENRGKS